MKRYIKFMGNGDRNDLGDKDSNYSQCFSHHITKILSKYDKMLTIEDSLWSVQRCTSTFYYFVYFPIFFKLFKNYIV